MKYFFCLASIIGCLLPSFAQTPYAFNYQGKAMNKQGEPLGNQTIALRISVVQSSDEGSIVFAEEHEVTTTAQGLFALQIGNGFPILGNLRNVSWGEDVYFVRVEMDPLGGNDFEEPGTTRLLSVPYALYAEESRNGGGASADDQTLILQGAQLSIENGNSVDLSPLLSTGEDADADPTNELQTLSLMNNTLSISDGNSITLPTTDSGGERFWQGDQLSIHYPGLSASIRPDGISLASIYSNSEQNAGVTQVRSSVDDRQIYVDGTQGIYGFFNGKSSYYLRENSSGTGGIMDFYGPAEEPKLRIASVASDGNTGFLATYGSNHRPNVRLTSLGSNPDHGYVEVFDGNDNSKAGIYVDNNGNGRVFADMKNFRMAHPYDEELDIVYASLEGPEAAAYLRGTTSLKNGSATVSFPDHFRHVIAGKQGMTIMLTPLNAQSKGMAVVEKSKEGFVVQELFEGSGNYEFDWEVKAVRSGFESYEVLQRKERPADRSTNNLVNHPVVSKQ